LSFQQQPGQSQSNIFSAAVKHGQSQLVYACMRVCMLSR
jgi:hypothetical protein